MTIVDFAAQALLIAALHEAFPDDAFLGEESADALRENDALAERVWSLVQQAAKAQNERETHAAASTTSDVQPESLKFPASKHEMFDLIDRGGKGEETRTGRVWLMDPIDGTMTYMKGQQYSVCLCLLVEGEQKVGVIGCPNLAFGTQDPLGVTRLHEDHVDVDGYGVVLSAVKGQGTYVRSMNAASLGTPRRIDHSTLPTPDLSSLNFVESTLGKTSLSQDEHREVASSLGAAWPGTVLWSQQMKYVALTLASTDVMIRIPKTKDRFTYVWDHAGGHILFEEAGGHIRDFDGGAIDFAQGRKIKGERNYGMIATRPEVFDRVERAVKEVLDRRSQ